MGIFDKMSQPIFLRESDRAKRQLNTLQELEPLLNEEGQALIRKEIKCLEYGIIGEKNIIFELKNSHMPMYILQDVYLQDGELSAQIDFLVFTRKICFVIECKNLYGDIEITKDGEFIRTMTFGNKKIKEGIYSPITQNERHLQLMKKIKKDRQSNILLKAVVNNFFESLTKSIVVLANPKTILNTRYARKEVKQKVIRADQLVDYIKQMHNQLKERGSSDEELLKWAQSYLNIHQEVDKDYVSKYDQYKKEYSPHQGIEETEIYQELRQYRLNKSREENIKPYFIYNNNELKNLILKMPKSQQELKDVQGFGMVKSAKYGEEILAILNKYR